MAAPEQQPLHLRVRTATHDRHVELEDTLLLLDDDVDLARYVEVLQAFAAVYGPLEGQIEEVLAGSGLADELSWPKRRKLSKLHADLAELDSLPNVTFQVPLIVASEAQVIGAMYVMEGATLGAQQIRPHLQSRLPVEGAMAFFDAYGAEAPAMWKSFRTQLTQPRWADEAEAVIQAASQTFDAFLAVAPTRLRP